MSKPVKQSPASKVAPFSVKRKQINFNLLDTPISRNSSQSSIHPTSILSSESFTYKQQLLKEKDDQIIDLKKQVDGLNQELQTTRHQNRLMENERTKFETNMIEKCSQEKRQVELELAILKKTHVDKMQDLSTTLNQLLRTIASLKDQLAKNNISIEQEPDGMILDKLIESQSCYKKDAQFIQDAYYKVKQETQVHHPLWPSIQNTTMSIKHEINDFHAWKSIPVADLCKLLKDDQKNHNSVRSLLFGRLKERTK
ncbi:unnamed protein product [Mucor circinelloides]|uniref:Uncharacterized protein n=1 Tax=Mucor circinelloides f. circinelloides (strain 1006PhL) TaxID=1220926 RepID=S2J6K8_MUCC1|nr:hypothetical protein HMPREF1544_07455 [Mucor circinelloides 1006PhL]